MNGRPSSEQPNKRIQGFKSIGPKALTQFFGVLLLMPGILFLSAGRLNWPMGWASVGILLVFTAVSLDHLTRPIMLNTIW